MIYPLKAMPMRFANTYCSYFFVCSQFLCLTILLWTGPILADPGVYRIVEWGAIALGLWALLTMRRGVLRILPDVAADAILVSQGPYRFIRHPMYTSVILLMTALVFNSPSAMRYATLSMLYCVLLGKLLYEEKLLKKSFAGYQEYCKTTWRLLPFIF